MKDWRRCSEHPEVNGETMWGCPDCLAFLRIENGRLRAELVQAQESAASTALRLVAVKLEAEKQHRMDCGCVVSDGIWDSTHCTVPGAIKRGRRG